MMRTLMAGLVLAVIATSCSTGETTERVVLPTAVARQAESTAAAPTQQDEPVQANTNTDDWEEIYVERIVEAVESVSPARKTSNCFSLTSQTDQEMRATFAAASMDGTIFAGVMADLGIEITQTRIDRGLDLAVHTNRQRCDFLESMDWGKVWEAIYKAAFEVRLPAEQLQTCVFVDQVTDDQIRVFLVDELVQSGEDNSIVQILDHYGIEQTPKALDQSIDIAIEALHEICD